jgi:hypothetical protein
MRSTKAFVPNNTAVRKIPGPVSASVCVPFSLRLCAFAREIKANTFFRFLEMGGQAGGITGSMLKME